MKKESFFSKLSWLFTVLFFISCGGGGSDDEGPVLSASPRFITLEATESVNISVNSNTSWDVTVDQNWLKYSPSGGSNNGSVSIHAEDNTTGADRTTHLTIKATRANITVDIQVTQKAKSTTPTPTPDPTLSVGTSSISLAAAGESKTFNITSNTSWTISSDQSWCTVDATSGSDNKTITVKADENKSTTSRSANITVKYGNKSVTVTVTQAGADVQLTVSPTSLSFTEKEESKTISIACNTSWKASSSESWCTVSPASGSNDGEVTVKVTANDVASERSATITVKDDNGKVTREVTVTQAAKPDGIGRDDYGDDTNWDKNK